MDPNRFDGLARVVGGTSRRHVVQGLLGGLLAGAPVLVDAVAVAAKKKRKKAGGGKHGPGKKSGGPRRSSPTCTPETPVATCNGRCGTWPNTCGQFVTCPPCTDGRQCVGNGSCAITCTGVGDPTCPADCGCSAPTAEGGRRCVARAAGCPSRTCRTSADCPIGQHCQTCAEGNQPGPGGCPDCAEDPGLPLPRFCFALCGA